MPNFHKRLRYFVLCPEMYFGDIAREKAQPIAADNEQQGKEQ